MIFPLCFGPSQTYYGAWRAELGGNQRLLPSVETALAIDWQISTPSRHRKRPTRCSGTQLVDFDGERGCVLTLIPPMEELARERRASVLQQADEAHTSHMTIRRVLSATKR